MIEQTDAVVASEHLVGNLWFNLEYVPVMAGVIEPETLRFAVGGNAAIAYSEMCRLLREGVGLTAGALEAGLKLQKFDFSWLAKLQSRIAGESLKALHQYAATINNAAELKKVQMYCADASGQAQDVGAKADVIKGDLLAKLANSGAANAHGIRSVSTVVDDIEQELEQIDNGTFNFGLSTGFKSLDKVFTMQSGDLITIAGRPSQGKTSLAKQVAFNVAQGIYNRGDNEQVVIFSADDTDKKLTYGLASAISRIDLNVRRAKDCPNEIKAKFANALAYIKDLPLLIDDTTSPTVDGLYYRCAMLNAQKPIALAVMDYMQLIKDDKAMSELQEARRAASGCKGIGHTLKFPFMLISQLTKEVEKRADKWPTPSDLSYAGEAESDACLLVMRPEHYVSRGEYIECDEADKKGVALINVGKNKQGRVGMVRMQFTKEFSAFGDLAE